MRDDFHAVFTDGFDVRYPDAARKRRRLRDDDGLPLPGARFARVLTKGWKEGSNRRFGPVERYLRSQVGRPWNDVHSDICAAFPCPARRRHLMEGAVSWRVETECLPGRDGVPVDARFGSPVDGFYVDPSDGVLREASRPGRGAYGVRQKLKHLTDPGLVPLPGGASLEVTVAGWFHRPPEDDRGTRGPGRQISAGLARKLRLAAWAEGADALAASVRGRRHDVAAERAQVRLLREIGKAYPAPRGNKGIRGGVSMDFDDEVEP